MNTSSVAFAARNRRNQSRTAVSPSLFGGAAIACLVLGSSYAVYTNIIAASVYPTLGSSDFDEPVIRQRPQALAQDASQVIKNVFAALPNPVPAISKPETTEAASAPMLPFSDRFAAAQPRGVESHAAEGAPPEAPKLAEASVPEPGYWIGHPINGALV